MESKVFYVVNETEKSIITRTKDEVGAERIAKSVYEALKTHLLPNEGCNICVLESGYTHYFDGMSFCDGRWKRMKHYEYI